MSVLCGCDFLSPTECPVNVCRHHGNERTHSTIDAQLGILSAEGEEVAAMSIVYKPVLPTSSQCKLLYRNLPHCVGTEKPGCFLEKIFLMEYPSIHIFVVHIQRK